MPSFESGPSEERSVADPEFEKLVQQFAERQQKVSAEDTVDWEEMKRRSNRALTVVLNRTGTIILSPERL
jgi:hypothetical protein